jgi:hypothetical protein
MEMERGFALIEDLAPKGLMPDLYEGLREEQVNCFIWNKEGPNLLPFKITHQGHNQFQ